MKKVIIALAAIISAIAVNASCVSWKVTTGDATLKVYAFANVTAKSVIDACASTIATDWTTQFGSGVLGTASGSGSRLAQIGVTDGVVANDTLVFAIVNGDIKDGTAYTVYAAEAIPAANVYDPPSSGTQLTFKMADLTSAGAGTFAAPEPTSGLLLLLGMAGLALKRKIA